MKKRIFYIILFLTAVTALAVSIVSAFVYYKFYVVESKDQIKTIIELNSDSNKWSNYTKINETAKKISKSVNYNIRITVIEDSGKVIYDNRADYENLDNHRNRPEIVKAFEIGYGENTRYSNTLESDTYYYAVKLDNNKVLRLSREIKNINSMFISTMPIMISILVLIILADLAAVSLMTRLILKPVKKMTVSLDDIMESGSNIDIDIYEEFEPLTNKIKEQKVKINEYISKLKYERDTIGIITENMKEGFILINKEKNILSINTSGTKMIGNDKFELKEHKNILELTRNAELIDSIDDALNENRHIVYDVDNGRSHYRYYLSPVIGESGKTAEGLLILIEDVTIQKNSENMRREFSANVSHELKTPLTTMIGFAELIKEGLVTDMDSIKKYCGMINKEGLRLISLIEDIIRLSKIEEGVEINNSGVLNLNEVCQETCRLLHSKAEEYKIKIIQDVDDICMNANKNYMHELLYNLIDNSIKYNRKGGNVKVSIKRESHNIRITVKDTGVGISEENQDRIFERFYRVDKSRSKETGGTGLGLSIVKHITELYKGTIEIKSQENVGTEITVKFPV